MALNHGHLNRRSNRKGVQKVYVLNVDLNEHLQKRDVGALSKGYLSDLTTVFYSR